MPKIILDIPNDIHEKLKVYAKQDDRSLTKYIIHGLEYLVNMPVPYHKCSYYDYNKEQKGE